MSNICSYAVDIKGAGSMEAIRAEAIEKGARFFGDTPFRIWNIWAGPDIDADRAQPGRAQFYRAHVSMRTTRPEAATPADDDSTGRWLGFTGYGSTPQEVEDDIIRQARKFFGPDVTLKVSRGYAFSTAASVSRPLRATTTVAMVEPGSVIVGPAAAAGRDKTFIVGPAAPPAAGREKA